MLRREEGLTLIEMLVTLSMIGFVVTALYSFYLAGLHTWNSSLDHLEQQQSARIALDKIDRELRYANYYELADGNRELRYRVSEDSRTRRFRLEGGELILDSYPTNHPLYFHTKVALDINSLQFEIDEAGVILVVIEAGRSRGGYRLNSAVVPRNLPAGGAGAGE